ncbi:MAG: Glutamate--tRNA ligase [Desulfovibrio sp.]
MPIPKILDLPRTVRGRLAPSPTGFLHLGNAWAFWAAWLGARCSGGELALRIEDIDPARSRSEYVTALMRDLAWLGIDWDYGPKTPEDENTFFWQSARSAAYEDALRYLEASGVVYPCYCTRKELRQIAGAPHVDDAGAPYPGTCRALSEDAIIRHEAAGRRPALRLLCPEDTVWSFDDAVMGTERYTLHSCGGDFALRRSDGVFAYQLAVVVDDIAMGVTHVVRGNDISVSTPRQMYLYSLFGETPPRYAHIPLVTDAAGERLAKRHASLTLGALREAGVLPETLLGWLAVSSGLLPEFAPVYPGERLGERFGERLGERFSGFDFTKIRAASLRLPPDPVARFLCLQKK